MLLTIEKVLILKSVSIFSSVPEAQLVDLATIVDSVEYESGEIIIRQGDLGNSMYIVADGRVRIFDRNHELSILGNRAVFGELAALDPEPRAASAEALDALPSDQQGRGPSILSAPTPSPFFDSMKI